MSDISNPELQSYEWLSSRCVEFRREDISLRLTFLERGIVRCHYVRGAIFEDFPSYGVDARFKSRYPHLEECEYERYIEIKSKALRVRVRTRDMGLEFYDRETGRPLSIDEEGLGHRAHGEHERGDEIVWMYKNMPVTARYYGLGDKPSRLNLRGKRRELWNWDHYSFEVDGDPLYKSIPFFLCIDQGHCHGIFFDNTMRSYFDFGKERFDRLVFGADGGQMNYYFMAAPCALEVVAQYTRLTGLPPLPPLWALGYHQSRWSYQSRAQAEDIVDRLREKRIPCDAIHLDLDHMEARQSLTWDEEKFPEPEQMIERLAQRGVQCVSILNPSVKIDPDKYIWRSGFEKNVFCRRHDGTLMEGDAWAGRCHFPDFTSPRVRAWWVSLFNHEIAEKGIRGLWVDMNEPALDGNKSFPNDTRHDYEGYPCSHLKAHNIYGQAMIRATRDAMRLHAPERRPFLLTRAGYAGMQRYAATWTGDTLADWTHLRLANLMVQRLSTSGVSFAGSDTGGFNEKPSPALFCRWMQLSAFHPFFRVHYNADVGEREPWSMGAQAEQHCKRSIEARYRLLPYFYTLFYRYATLGLPLIRSLVIQHSEIEELEEHDDEFFLGDALYIVPVLRLGELQREIYLTRGQWYSYWTDESYGMGGRYLTLPVELDRLPVLVKAGHLIPHWPVQQHVGEIEHPPVTYDLWWLHQGEEESSHYEDAGEGYDYKQGHYLYHCFSCVGEQSRMRLKHDWSGDIRLAGQDEVDLAVHGLAARQRCQVRVEEKHAYDAQADARGVLRLRLPRFFQQIDLQQN